MNNKINTEEVILFNILYMFMNCDFDVLDITDIIIKKKWSDKVNEIQIRFDESKSYKNVLNEQ